MQRDWKALSATLPPSAAAAPKVASRTQVESKAVVSAPDGWVFEVRAPVTLQHLVVKSFGGDPGAASNVSGSAGGVRVLAGSISVENCRISSVNGTGLVTKDEVESVKLVTSIFGPCGRSGIVLNSRVVLRSMITGIKVRDCTLAALSINTGIVGLKDCFIEGCTQGVQGVQATSSDLPTTIELSSVRIERCERGIWSYNFGAKDAVTIACSDCVVKECPKALEASGEKAVITWGSSNTAEACGAIIVFEEKGGKIEGASTKTAPAPASPAAGAETSSKTFRLYCFPA